MLNFNLLIFRSRLLRIDLNTSHVKLQLARTIKAQAYEENLNTSHVKLQQIIVNLKTTIKNI